MSKKRFGTDGLRGVANGNLTPEVALSLGQAAGRYLKEAGLPLKAVIGRDTRKSGPMLSSALIAGLTGAGIDVTDIGIAPTPTVSHAVRNGDFAMGMVISASHNPAPDNGIKLLAHDGRKFSDEAEIRIEQLMEEPYECRPLGGEVGSYIQDEHPKKAYLDFLETIVPERLAGMHIALDAAHGAAYELGQAIFERLGAKVTAIGCKPDGVNINEHVGATSPQTVQDLTEKAVANVGVAFDGDADRVIFSDEQGRLINGDRTIAAWAEAKLAEGKLNPPIVVGTIMSNMGVEKHLDKCGIKLERTPVGDKYVSQRIAETGAHIGGEQSGHIVFPAHGPTGDGLATALEFLRVLKLSGKPASQIIDSYEAWPQILINITLPDKDSWKTSKEIEQAIADGTADIGAKGRVNVRASGTQPMVRVMVEADSYELRDSVANNIVSAFMHHGGTIYSKVDLTHALGD